MKPRVLTSVETLQVQLHLGLQRLWTLEDAPARSPEEQREMEQLRWRLPQMQVQLGAMLKPEIPENLPRLVAIYCVQTRQTLDPAWEG